MSQPRLHTIRGKPFQRRFTANSINDMRGGRIKFLMISHTTDRITRLLFVCGSSTSMSWNALSCRVSFSLASTHYMESTVLFVSSRLDAMSCLAMSHLVHRHVTPNQLTLRSLFARRRHSTDDVICWRSAIRQVPVASAMRATQNSSDTSNSETWSHQLVNYTHE